MAWYNPTFLVHLILADTLTRAYLFPLAVILGTLILEDLTTILVGILASQGAVAIWIALLALYAGIVIGDSGLYWLGALGRTHPWIGRFVHHERLRSMRERLEGNLRRAVVTTRFIPGLRLPTYLACGFFRMSFREFFESAVFATLIWTTGLFGFSYVFGIATESWLGVWRWPIAIGVAVAILVFERYRMRRNRVP